MIREVQYSLVWRLMMKHCEEITFLISESQDRQLTLAERFRSKYLCFGRLCRVKQGGGKYSGNRLYGGEGASNKSKGVAVSRAVAAFDIGEALSCLPKVGKFWLDPEAEHEVILQCDGMYNLPRNVGTTENYGQLGFELKSNPAFLKSGISLAEAFLKNAFVLGTKDNITSLTTPLKVSADDLFIPSDAKGVQQAKDYIHRIENEAFATNNADMS